MSCFIISVCFQASCLISPCFRCRVLISLCEEILSQPHTEQVSHFLLPALRQSDPPFPALSLIQALSPACRPCSDQQKDVQLTTQPTIWMMISVLTLVQPHLGKLCFYHVLFLNILFTLSFSSHFQSHLSLFDITSCFLHLCYIAPNKISNSFQLQINVKNNNPSAQWNACIK